MYYFDVNFLHTISKFTGPRMDITVSQFTGNRIGRTGETDDMNIILLGIFNGFYNIFTRAAGTNGQ
jgi:hypothetical protein